MARNIVMYDHNKFESATMPEPNSGCWIWMNGITSFGYGRLKHNAKSYSAHRFSWMLYRGPIPHGKWILHKCDTPSCVNPDHLFCGTNVDNILDMVSKGRNSKGEKHSRAKISPARGEQIGNSKLTREQVVSILDDARPQRQIAASYGVSQCQIHNIKSRKQWK